MVRFLAVQLLLCVCVLQSGLAQDADLPPREPILQIEAGMHTGAIRRVGADAACSIVATGSEDKTVRLWRLSDGKLLKVMHPAVGAGNDGKIYAVAVAPNGEWIAAGGFSRTHGHHFVYLFQSATGAMVRSFGPFPQIVEHLAISPDGQFLAAALRGGQGLRVWQRAGSDLSSWKLVADDREYGGKDSTGAAFDRNGALYTVSYDRKLRRYAAGFEGKAESLITAGLAPHAVSAHPSDGLVAVSYADGNQIDVYETSPLRRSYAVEAGPAGSGALNAVAWSGDGQQLFAGGTYAVDKAIVVKAWGERGKGPSRNIKGPRDAVMHLFPCAGGVAVAAGDPAFGLLRADGSRPLWNEAVGADMRGKLQKNFTVSGDGLMVRFGLQEGDREPVLLDLQTGVLSDAPANPDSLYPPDDESLPITNWRSATTPRLEGNLLQLALHERAQSVAVTPDKTGFVLGTDYSLRNYDRDGGLLWQMQAPGVIWGVNVARQQNLVVAACGDGTLRWYRLNDGALLLSVFIQRADRRWIAWTPEGYFTTSVGGEDLIGWTVNRSWSEAADFFAASQFRKIFYRPDIVRQVFADDRGAVDTDTPTLVLKHQPPVVRIISPGERAIVTSSEVTITFNVRSPSGMPIKRLSLFVGGVLANPESRDKLLAMDPNFQFTGTLKVKIPPQNVEISLVAETAEGASEPARSSLVRPAPEPEAAAVKPNLYALLIGVGDYDEKTLKLASPSNDVDDFEVLLKMQEGKAFGKITVVKLKDRGQEPATSKNIMQKLVWLKKQVEAPEDIAMVYFSGHGQNLPGAGGSYLLPVDFDGEPDLTGISKTSLFGILRQINGGLILFIDACYAANGLDTVDFVNETASWHAVKVISYASSNRSEVSRTKGKNSFFTRALIDAFGGNAPHRGNALRTDELSVWLSTSVPQLAAPEKQTPQMNKSPAWQHIPIAYD